MTAYFMAFAVIVGGILALVALVGTVAIYSSFVMWLTGG